MNFETDHQEKFQNLAVALAEENRDNIRIEANGGNSILFVYPPKDELKYIEKAKEKYPNAEFIDVREALVEFIDSIGWEDFEDYYKGYQTEPENIFRDSDDEEKLESLIIGKIKKTINDEKLPFVIHTGALFGTEIENIHIVENTELMKFGIPLVVFYPADIQPDGQIKYLGFKPASKYRCKLVK